MQNKNEGVSKLNQTKKKNSLLINFYSLLAIIIVIIPEKIAESILEIGSYEKYNKIPPIGTEWKKQPELKVSALNAEGVEGLINGFANLHLLPMYQQKIAYQIMSKK